MKTFSQGRAVAKAAKAWLLACLVATAALAAGSALAQTPSLRTTKPWSSLTAEQRDALKPLERDWASIEPSRQQKWLDVAGRFSSLTPEDRDRVKQRMADWARMTPDERGRARMNYQELRNQTAPDERQSRWEAYQALPDSQKRELAKRANGDTMTLGGASTRGRTDGAKSAIVAPSQAAQGSTRPVGPTVVRTAPGATTNLVSQPAKPPMHQQEGMPKMAAKPGFVDAQTLLPKRGMQGAAVATQTDKGDGAKRQ